MIATNGGWGVTQGYGMYLTRLRLWVPSSVLKKRKATRDSCSYSLQPLAKGGSLHTEMLLGCWTHTLLDMATKHTLLFGTRD